MTLPCICCLRLVQSGAELDDASGASTMAGNQMCDPSTALLFPLRLCLQKFMLMTMMLCEYLSRRRRRFPVSAVRESGGKLASCGGVHRKIREHCWPRRRCQAGKCVDGDCYNDTNNWSQRLTLDLRIRCNDVRRSADLSPPYTCLTYVLLMALALRSLAIAFLAFLRNATEICATNSHTVAPWPATRHG